MMQNHISRNDVNALRSGLKRYDEYLRGCIARWYQNAYLDYGISGRVLEIVEPVQFQLEITWEEIRPEDGGKTAYRLSVPWYVVYTPEEIYNIWMEADDAECVLVNFVRIEPYGGNTYEQ